MNSFSDNDINKYKDIISEIRCEEEKHNELKKKFEQCKKQLQANEIINNPTIAQDKLFQVCVKVFPSVIELISLYPDKVSNEDVQLLSQHDESNLFLIEVYIANVLHDTVMSKDWLLDVAITADNCKTCRCIQLQHRAVNPITTVLPVRKSSSNEEIVEVSLTSATNWRRIQLAAIQTDISYKFSSADASITRSQRSLVEDVKRIARLYRGEEAQTMRKKRVTHSYKMLCKTAPDVDSFIPLLVRNAYHNINPSHIISNEGNLAAKIEINGQRVQLVFDSASRHLSMEASGEELYQLKRYFANECLNNYRADRTLKVCKKDLQHMQNIDVLKELRKELSGNLQCNRINIQSLLNAYDVYNRFIDGCPL